MPAKAVKKRNPNDATFRNITALKDRVAKLEATVAKLTKPSPRDPKDDAYWRSFRPLTKADAEAILDRFYRRITGQIR